MGFNRAVLPIPCATDLTGGLSPARYLLGFPRSRSATIDRVRLRLLSNSGQTSRLTTPDRRGPSQLRRTSCTSDRSRRTRCPRKDLRCSIRFRADVPEYGIKGLRLRSIRCFPIAAPSDLQYSLILFSCRINGWSPKKKVILGLRDTFLKVLVSRALISRAPCLPVFLLLSSARLVAEWATPENQLTRSAASRQHELATNAVDPLAGYLINWEISTSDSLVKLQVLLRREWRTPEGIEEVSGLLTSMGITPTATGLATISADVEQERFEKLFGQTAREIAPKPPGERNFGESGGHVTPELTVPAPLRQHVQSISAAPPHIYFQA